MGLFSAIAGLFGARMEDKRAKQTNTMAQRQFDAQMDQTVQRRVEDATKAGIHPLYAMGASPGASPTIMAGQHSSGSGLGSAIANVGASIDQSIADRKHAKSQKEYLKHERNRQAALDAASIERDKASANRDNAQAMATRSAMMRSVMNANVTRGSLLQDALSHKVEEAKPVKGRKLTTPIGKFLTGPYTDQQVVEDIYGGALGEVYGILRAATEAGHALGQSLPVIRRNYRPNDPVDTGIAP